VLAGQTNSATTLDLSLPAKQTGHSTEPRWSDATARAGYVMTMSVFVAPKIAKSSLLKYPPNQE